MAAVVFAFGSKPALTERQALEVAAALSARPNVHALRASGKIRDAARVDVDAGETSEDVALEPEELAELTAVMSEIDWPDDEPEYEHLRRQLLHLD